MQTHSTSNRLTVDQPTRDAERNRTLVNQSDPTADRMLLPSLEDGITLLDIEGDRGVPLLQSLVLDHLLLHDGPAFWVDANGHATTTSLAQIAPSRRLLDRIHVTRGFTAYQHYSAVCELPTAVNQSIQDAAADERARQPPALIVVPAVDAQYRADDTLEESHAATLQARSLAWVATYAERYEVPVLVTRTDRDAFTTPIETAADHHLECEYTRMGPRIVGEDFETLVYPIGDGTYYQTTFAYWRQLLAARATQVGVESVSTTPSPQTPDDIGTGVTIDGEPVSVPADPLLDAWTVDAGGQ